MFPIHAFRALGQGNGGACSVSTKPGTMRGRGWKDPDIFSGNFSPEAKLGV